MVDLERHGDDLGLLHHQTFRLAATLAMAWVGLSAAPSLGQPVLRVDADAPPGGDGQSWLTAYNDLQDALDQAAGDPSVEELWVAQGVYLPDRGTADPLLSFVVHPSLDIYGGFAGNETQREQRDPSTRIVVLSGAIDPDNDVHTLQVVIVTVGSGPDTILDGLVITEGKAVGPRQDGTDEGGGLFAINASPTVRQCTLINNTAARTGGGALAGGMLQTPHFFNCDFIGNHTAVQATLGGAYSGTGELTNCRFSDNIANRGGAIYCNTEITIDSCVFDRNIAMNEGGAIRVENNAAMHMSACRFNENHAAVRGGAVSITGPHVTIGDCSFFGNECDLDGGAMFYQDVRPANAFPFVVDRCVFGGNSALRDGGACFATDPARMLFLQCWFTGNTSIRDGGAIAGLANASDSTTLTLWNSVLAANSAAGRGGAVYVRGTRASALIANSILWDNSDSGGSGEDAQAASIGAALEFNHCDVQGWTGQLGGNGNFGVDPLLADLTGPDQIVGTDDDDLHLSAGSPCIDAGDNDVLPPYVLTDLDENPRYMDDPNSVDTGHGTSPMVDVSPFEFEGRTFVMQPPVPGVAGQMNIFAVRGAPPHTIVHFVWGLHTGRTRIPGCPPSVVLGIGAPQILGTSFVSIRGNADLGLVVPRQASGLSILLQAVQVDSCTVCDVLEFTFD